MINHDIHVRIHEGVGKHLVKFIGIQIDKNVDLALYNKLGGNVWQSVDFNISRDIETNIEKTFKSV